MTVSNSHNFPAKSTQIALRGLPNSTELPNAVADEMALLGCIIENPGFCWRILDKHKVTGRWFYDERLGQLFTLLASLKDYSGQIPDGTILERAKARGITLEQQTLFDIHDACTVASNIEAHLSPVADAHRERTLLFGLRDAWRVAMDPNASLEAKEDALQCVAASRTGNAGHNPGELDALRWNFDNQPPTVPPVFTLNGTEIATAGNLQTISAAAKAGKSAFVNAMLAAIMTPDDTRDTFGVRSANPKGFAVVHCDTEQSRGDHWKGIARAMRRAGLNDRPPWLQSYTLAGHSAADCRRLMQAALEDGAGRFGGIHSVHIDGAADLVADVNDAEECNGFVAHLHGLAIKFGCPIANVIHVNPNGEKTRGHLGSQLERKSETNLRLDKDGEATLVWSERQRGAPITKGTGPRFAWSDEAGMHVSVQSAQSERRNTKAEQHKETVSDMFASAQGTRHTDLVRWLQNNEGVSAETAKRRLKDFTGFGLIKRDAGGFHTKNF